jgi:hypothetical protein
VAEAVTDGPRDPYWHEDDEEVVDGRPMLPPDPAGTQPKVDRDKLLPARIEEVDEPPRFTPPLPSPVSDGGDEAVVVYDANAEPPHAAKFQFILGALLAVGIVGLAALGLLLADNSSDNEASGPAWSAWKPNDSGVEGAQQIADHVAPGYKISNGEQMAAVTAKPLEAQDTKLRVALRRRGDDGGKITLYDGGSVLFEFCGLADRCAIKGTPSKSRALLLRREALEIALYSFRYLNDVDQVVMFMPPSFLDVPTKTSKKPVRVPLENQALLFRRDDFKSTIAAPLERTLPEPPPVVAKVRERPEASLVANLVVPRAFTYSLVPSNVEDEAFLVLEQLNTQEAIIRQRELELDRQKRAAELSGGTPAEGDGNQ